MHRTDMLAIGELAARTGLAVSAIRFYEARGLVSALRNSGGQRRFLRFGGTFCSACGSAGLPPGPFGSRGSSGDAGDCDVISAMAHPISAKGAPPQQTRRPLTPLGAAGPQPQ